MKYFLLILLMLQFNLCFAQYYRPHITVDNSYTNVTTVTFSPNWEITSVQRHSTGWIDTTNLTNNGWGAAWVTHFIKNIQQHDSHCYTITFKKDDNTGYYTTTLWLSSENIEWRRR